MDPLVNLLRTVLRRLMAWARWGVVCSLFLAFSARAELLRADVKPLSLRPRSQAPMLVDVTLTRQGSGVLQGVLELSVEDSGEVRFRQRTADLALINGAQSFRLLLPPLELAFDPEARLRFFGPGKPIDLGRFPLLALNTAARNLSIGVCTGRETISERSTALWQSLRPERLDPAPNQAAANPIPAPVGRPRRMTALRQTFKAQLQAVTTPVFIPPEDIPTNPLTFCALDLLLLSADGFRAVKEKQLAAIARWVEAGGSLCVIGAGAVSSAHADFLNGFAAGQEPAPFQIDPDGRLAWSGTEPLRFRAGLGRVVVASEAIRDDLDQLPWREAAAFLWKVRASEQSAVARDGHWSGTVDLGEASRSSNDPRRRHHHIQGFLHTLLPKSTRLLPPHVIAAILGGFILVVGPLDYFVLGWLRRRRWTWVTFPLASLACTSLTVYAANRALGANDHRAALVIRDVGPGGRFLRESRFELLFAGRNKEAITQTRNALIVPADSILTGRSGERRSEPPLYHGQFPANYTMRQQLRQWTPQLNRITRFDAGAADAAAIPWDVIESEVISAKILALALESLARRFPHLKFYGQRGITPPSGSVAPMEKALLNALSGPLSGGVFSLFSRTSPSAGDLDDLALLDSSNDREWLLVVRQESAGEIIFHRRLVEPDLFRPSADRQQAPGPGISREP